MTNAASTLNSECALKKKKIHSFSTLNAAYMVVTKLGTKENVFTLHLLLYK